MPTIPDYGPPTRALSTADQFAAWQDGAQVAPTGADIIALTAAGVVSKFTELAAPFTGHIEDDLAEAVAARNAAVAARDQAIATLQLLPTQYMNGHLKADQPTPNFVFTTPTFVSVESDAVFAASGIDRAVALAPGDQMFLEQHLEQPVPAGHWLTAAMMVSIDDTNKWAALAGRFAVLGLKVGGNYGNLVQIGLDNSPEVVDDTHRIMRMVYQVPTATTLDRATFNITNIESAGAHLKVSGFAVQAAATQPVGVDIINDDPFGVQEVARRVLTEAVPEFYDGGDSLTDGSGASDPATTGFVARVAYYLGSTGTRYGVPGSQSTAIVDRELSVPIRLAGNKLDADGSTVITGFHGNDIEGVSGSTTGNWALQPLTSPATGRTFSKQCRVAGVLCTMTRTGTPSTDTQTTHEDYVLTYDAMPADIPVAEGYVEAVFTPPPTTAIRAIWSGTNDRYDAATVLANHTRWLEAASAWRRLIIGPVNAASDISSTGLYYSTRQIIAQHQHAFGDLFIDAFGGVIAHGLLAAGLTPNSTDLANIAAGIIPQRLVADGLHFNDFGYDALAQIVVCRMMRLGWVRPEQLAHVPLLYTLGAA